MYMCLISPLKHPNYYLIALFQILELSVLRMRTKPSIVVPSDSEDETSSDTGSSGSVATVVNQAARKMKAAAQNKKRGRPFKKTNAKRQRTKDGSGSDTSPQPSTSQAGIELDSDEDTDFKSAEESESESEDSDYGPLRDKSKKKKPPSPPKRRAGRPPRIASQPRITTPSYVNGSADIVIDPKNVEALAQRLVYFLLVEDQKKYAIRRNAIYDNVFRDEYRNPKLYNAVIKKANFILKKVYGMELMELENQKDRYLIVNILKRELGIHDYVEVSRVKQQQHGLILYLLTIIFMNDNVITEEDLTKSLKQLGIDLTAKKLHPVFGDIKKYITTELVKQMYLNYECVSKEPPKFEFTWGIRAKQEFDKKDLLQFACQIMDDTTPESWRMQFKDAEKSATPKVTTNGTA